MQAFDLLSSMYGESSLVFVHFSCVNASLSLHGPDGREYNCSLRDCVSWDDFPVFVITVCLELTLHCLLELFSVVSLHCLMQVKGVRVPRCGECDWVGHCSLYVVGWIVRSVSFLSDECYHFVESAGCPHCPA